jgi:hypothetical protein
MSPCLSRWTLRGRFVRRPGSRSRSRSTRACSSNVGGDSAATAISISLHDVGLANASWLAGEDNAKVLRQRLLHAYAQSSTIHSIEVQASAGVDGAWVEQQLRDTKAVWAMGEGWEPDPGRGFRAGIGGSGGGSVEVAVSEPPPSTTASEGMADRGGWQGGAAVFGVDDSMEGAISAARTASEGEPHSISTGCSQHDMVV